MRGYRIPKQEFLWSEIDHDQCFKITPLFITELLYSLYIRIELKRDNESEDTTIIGHKPIIGSFHLLLIRLAGGLGT
jgi:hypothetical protein